METRIGRLDVVYSARGVPTFRLDLWHDGLKKHRLLRGDSEAVIQRKAQLQIEDWTQKWAELSSRQAQRQHRELGKQLQEERKSEASARTSAAQEVLQSLATLLHATLAVDDRVDWEKLKDKSRFPDSKPTPLPTPRYPDPPRAPREPQETDSRYKPHLGFLDKLISSRKARIVAEKESLLAEDRREWNQEVQELERAYKQALKDHADEVERLRKQYDRAVKSWEERRAAFLDKQAAANAAVDAKRIAYESRQPEAILEYIDLVLAASDYPECFPHEFDIDYDPEAQTVVVDYQLPSPDDLPRLKSVKYAVSRDDFEEQYITDSQADKQYDEVLYQVVLRTVHELFESDVVRALEFVVVNGIVTATDRTTGKPVTSCVLSLRASRDEFTEINLAQVDPKACFKALKGVGSSKLHGLAPVPPIMPLRREDGRFVSAYEVANTLDAAVNLAAMNWEDFEHLIREIFEKEFSSSGGEVKVTQASRDGGVDAVAFDPDPIRGGKIVIQAKRYTGTVGVSAVRDLYGTVLNEGATKGVLVTTSDYGPDSYAFANGKPLVLLSGANLLHMLERHGHKARIDLVEAKKLAAR